MAIVQRISPFVLALGMFNPHRTEQCLSAGLTLTGLHSALMHCACLTLYGQHSALTHDACLAPTGRHSALMHV